MSIPRVESTEKNAPFICVTTDQDGNIGAGLKGSFDMTFGGAFTDEQTCTINYTKINDVVTLTIPEIIAPVSHASTITSSDTKQFPEFLWPTEQGEDSVGLNILVFGQDNSVNVLLNGVVRNGGYISFGVGAGYSSFTASGNGGFYQFPITYKTTKMA